MALINWCYGFFVLPESLPKERRRAFAWRRANPVAALKGLAALKGVGALVWVIGMASLAQQRPGLIQVELGPSRVLISIASPQLLVEVMELTYALICFIHLSSIAFQDSEVSHCAFARTAMAENIRNPISESKPVKDAEIRHRFSLPTVHSSVHVFTWPPPIDNDQFTS
jgi:hypothetical protein